MNSIIESAEVREALVPMSVEFYHAAGDLGWLDEDVELLEGFPVKKMSKSPLHEYLVSTLQRMLEKVLPGTHFVTKERPLTCRRSEPEPDLMVVRGDERSFRTSHPATAELVVEVAINTLDKDRRKAAIYAGAAVKEYWLVDPTSASITVHRRPEPAGYDEVTTHAGKVTVASSVVPGFEISLPEFFA